MRNSIEVVTVAPGGFAPRAERTHGDAPTVMLRTPSADNDAVGEDQPVSSSARPTSYELYHAARAHRSLVIGNLFIAMLRAMGAIVRRAHAQYRQRRSARAVYDALRHLDDRMLRDLGFHRSEISSIAAEVTGAAVRERVRVMLLSSSSP